jgi:hypothetical protein
VSSSSSSTTDTNKAVGALVTLSEPQNEYKILAAKYHPASLPPECYNRNSNEINEVAYKRYVWKSLTVDEERMSKRKTSVEPISFYECLLLIKEEREHPDVKLITRPRSNKDLVEHAKKIQVIRDSIHDVVVNDYDDNKYEDMLDVLVKKWNINYLRAAYPTVDEKDLKELLTCDTLISYNSRTDYNWYEVSEIEITAAVYALGINLLIWDTSEHKYHNFSIISNKDWCVLTKDEFHFELMYISDKNKEGIQRFRFDRELFSEEMKAIFQLEE